MIYIILPKKVTMTVRYWDTPPGKLGAISRKSKIYRDFIFMKNTMEVLKNSRRK
jgi:hypothetical protein